MFLLCLGFLLPFIALAGEDDLTYRLGPGQILKLDEDGSLILRDAVSGEVVLGGRLDSLVDERRQRDREVERRSVSFQAREGQEGGHRGYSRRADDDGDGWVDEDPLDGLDNDGDGLRDEDFAAISDHMTALSLTQGQGTAHLEFMQWRGPRLQQNLFLSLQAAHQLGDAVHPHYRLDSGGESWVETEIACGRHDLQGVLQPRRGVAYVSRLVNEESPGEAALPSALVQSGGSSVSWLGVLILNSEHHGPGRREFLPRIENGTLNLPLNDEPLALVICKAASWVQLNRLLLDARGVYEGVQDPVSGRQVHWIVPPLCVHCRQETAVDFTATIVPAGGLELALDLRPGLSGLVDPDLFTLGRRPLGIPAEIRWEPADGPARRVFWGENHPGVRRPTFAGHPAPFCDLGLGANHDLTGRLVFQFPSFSGGFDDPGSGGKGDFLQGTWLDGRTFSATGEIVLQTETRDSLSAASKASNGEAARSSRERESLQLAPALLDGWPNPFRDRITLEFRVPGTVGETFDWTRIDRLPEGWEKSAPMAWKGGRPTVSVKMYSVNGQELASLREGSFGTGRYAVTWDGTDASGRPLASGTYFCKLQMDDYSVTRRIVFLR